MRWPLSLKISLSLGGFLLALSAVVAALTFVEMRRAAIDKQQALADALNYTFETLLSQEAVPSLQRVVENAATSREVQTIIVVDRDGVVLASSARMDVGKPIHAPLLREFLAQARWQRVTRSTEDALVILQPLRGSRSFGGAAGDIVGVAELTLSLDVIEGQARATVLRLLAISLGSLIALSVALALVLRTLVTKPVRELAGIAQRIRDGDRKLRSRIHRKDEIGLLSATFDDMANEVETILGNLEDQVIARTADLEAQRGALERTLEELRATSAARLSLAETVRELSTPVIKLYEGVLVVPLIGHIDAERAQQIQASLLTAIERDGASEVILDLTGVPFVDTAVAAALLQAARAAQLLGAGVTIVGITARVAQSIVGLGIDLSSVVTRSNLQSGLLHALRAMGLSVGKVRASAPLPEIGAPVNGLR